MSTSLRGNKTSAEKEWYEALIFSELSVGMLPGKVSPPMARHTHVAISDWIIRIGNSSGLSTRIHRSNACCPNCLGDNFTSCSGGKTDVC